MGLICWQQKYWDGAIKSWERTRDILEPAIPQVKGILAGIRDKKLAMTRDKTTTEQQWIESWKTLQEAELFLKADGAYYYAGRYSSHHGSDVDALEALGLARQLPDTIESSKDRDNIHLMVDSYLFVLSRVPRELLEDEDKETFKRLFKQFRVRVQKYLERNFPTERAQELFSDYECLSEEI